MYNAVSQIMAIIEDRINASTWILLVVPFSIGLKCLILDR